MTMWVEQQICTKFCVKLEHSPTETTEMIQKVTAMDNWWLVVSSQQQHACSCTMSRAEFFGKTSNHPGDSAPLQPRFLKPKSGLKGKRFQTVSEIQENTTGKLMVIGRTVWGPKVPTLKGTRAWLSYVQCFLYLVSSSINVSIFHIAWLDTFWTYVACMHI